MVKGNLPKSAVGRGMVDLVENRQRYSLPMATTAPLDMVESSEADSFKPPYISFVTLTNFLDRFGQDPPPPQVDKSFLETYSGANQAMLVSVLRTFGLVDSDRNVLPPLLAVSTDEDERKRYLDQKLRKHYAELDVLAAQNGTAQQLENWFKQYDYRGSTLRKAILFYLSAAEYVGLPRSPHFRVPKVPVGSQRHARHRPAAATLVTALP